MRVGKPGQPLYELLAAKPSLQRFRAELEGMGTLETGFNGEIGWEIHPLTGTRILAGLEHQQAASRADYGAPLKPPDSYERLETVARTEFEGRPCWKIELVSKVPEGQDPTVTRAARTSTEYYEVESGLYAGSESTRVTPQGNIKVTSLAADWKTFGQRLIPTTLTTRMPGQTLVLRVSSFQYDVVATDAFELPRSVLALLEDY